MIDTILIQRAIRTAISVLQYTNNQHVVNMLEQALEETKGIDGILEQNKGYRFRYHRDRRP